MTGEQVRRNLDKTPRLEYRSPETAPLPRPVVFVLPGLGGEDDPDFEGFWQPMRSRFDLVKIRYFDWTELVETGCDIDALAAHVRRQIEGKIPAGPVRLAGYSIGGHLAYSTALAFQSEGRWVESVAVLDACVNVSGFTPSFCHRMRARLKRLASFDARAGIASVVAKCLVMDGSRPVLRQLSRYRHLRLPFRFETFLHHKITMQLVRRIYPAWWSALLRQAPPLEAPTWLFRSEEHETGEPEDLGWVEYCPNLKVIRVAGSHRGMLKPPVNGPLRAAFAEAMTAPGGQVTAG